jgi:hypothetical protein
MKKTILAIAIAALAAASAGAIDLTGTWNGKYSCQDFDGDYAKFKSSESVLRIVQTGTTLVASIDGGAGTYDGAVIDSTAKPAQEGEAVLNLCLTSAAPLGGGELFKIKAKVDPEKGTGTISGVSHYEGGTVVNTCKLKYKRVSTDPGKVDTCMPPM